MLLLQVMEMLVVMVFTALPSFADEKSGGGGNGRLAEISFESYILLILSLLPAFAF